MLYNMQVQLHYNQAILLLLRYEQLFSLTQAVLKDYPE